MGNINFGGLASGLDTTSIISQLIAVESRPLQFFNSQRSTLESQAGAIQVINTRLNALENAAFDLTQPSTILGNKATSSDTDILLATANSNATTGSFQVDVLRLATASRVKTGSEAGQGNDIGGIADISDFSADTLNQINTDNRLSADISVGTFTVNGQNVTVNGSDTLNDVFAKINTATGGSVSASLNVDPASGGQVIELSSASPITLASGTSNILSALNLDTASYSGGTLTSSSAVNSIASNLKLDGSEGATNLAQAVGSGVLVINGTDIAYDAANDSLNDIIQRINDSDAGVRANFAAINGGRITLSSEDSGPLNIALSDSGNLVDALGLAAADSATLGQSAQIQIDGGPTQSFNTNTGIQAAGVDGIVLDLKQADPGNAITVSVDPNTDDTVSKVKKFVEQFNQTVSQIDQLTRYDVATGEKGILISDFTVSGVESRLRSMLFDRVSGLSGGDVGSLAEVGLSTGAVGAVPGSATTLELDESKLRAAIEANPTRVAQLFGAEETSSGSEGIFQRFKSYLDGLSNSSGVFAQKAKTLEQRIENIDDRIEVFNDRLLARQEQLQRQFTALERAIADLQAQQSSLSSLFSSF